MAQEATYEAAQQALNQLLNAIVPVLSKQSENRASNVSARINQCIDLVKAEASEAASLIADCAPQGRPMLAQAQQQLESLESLKVLEAVAAEMYGA